MFFKKLVVMNGSQNIERFSDFIAKTITYPESRRFKLLFKLIKSSNCSLGLLMTIASIYPSKALK